MNRPPLIVCEIVVRIIMRYRLALERNELVISIFVASVVPSNKVSHFCLCDFRHSYKIETVASNINSISLKECEILTMQKTRGMLNHGNHALLNVVEVR